MMILYIGGTIVLYLIYVCTLYIFGMNYITKQVSPQITNAKTRDVYTAATLSPTPYGQGIRQTFSFWIYVNDLNYRYGMRKYIFTKETPGQDTPETTDQYTPNVRLYIAERSADIKMEYRTSVETTTTVTVSTISLKKWHNLTIVQDRNTLDILLNGRVVFTSGETAVKATIADTIILSDKGGWNGHRSKFTYSNFNQTLQGIRATVDEGPLQMSYMNPLYYVFVLVGYINAANNYVLGLLLPDPQKAAKDAMTSLQNKESATEQEVTCTQVEVSDLPN